jgi:hypothetical protein
MSALTQYGDAMRVRKESSLTSQAIPLSPAPEVQQNAIFNQAPQLQEARTLLNAPSVYVKPIKGCEPVEQTKGNGKTKVLHATRQET